LEYRHGLQYLDRVGIGVLAKSLPIAPGIAHASIVRLAIMPVNVP
jgi:hypothetical protein